MLDRAVCAELAVVTLTAVTLAACGDGTGPDADLTQEQAEEVAQALSQSAYRHNLGSSGAPSILGPATSSPSLSRRASANMTVGFSTTGEGACRGGGSVSWSVDVEAVRGELRDSVAVNGTLAHDACTATSGRVCDRTLERSFSLEDGA